MPFSPPRLVTGIALLIWGALTGNQILGLIAAILIEAHSWTKLRWDFSYKSYSKAWQASLFLGGVFFFTAWINGTPLGKINTLFVWTPLLLLPVELAQRFGKANAIPLNTFSYFARRKMQSDIANGHSVSPRMINTGYPYTLLTVMATAMASREQIYYLVVLCFLYSICMFFIVKGRGLRPVAWPIAFSAAMVLTGLSQYTINQLYHYFYNSKHDTEDTFTSTNISRTSIGRLEYIKLSPKIRWRLETDGAAPPRLLRSATYNFYNNSQWKHQVKDESGGSRISKDSDFLTETLLSVFPDRDVRTFLDDGQPNISEVGNLTITGAIDASRKENPILIPQKMMAFGDLGFEVDSEKNLLGTVRIANPIHHVIQYTVWNGKTSTTDAAPNPNFDFQVPRNERGVIQKIVTDLDLKNPAYDTKTKVALLRHFFTQNFKYSTHLTTPKFDQESRTSAIGTFLTKTRSGHCEFFASATALILREAGIPSRYAVGFAVSEFDADDAQWILRGQHAHAWCRVWFKDESSSDPEAGYWEDVDLTPGSWLEMDTTESPSWKRKLSDWWQLFREDFLIWRTQKTNQTIITIIIITVGCLVALWVFVRLWKAKNKTQMQTTHYFTYKNHNPTALNLIENKLRKKIGLRLPNEPLNQWLMKLCKISPKLKPTVQSAVQLHSSLRFDPICKDFDLKSNELEKLVKEIIQQAKKL